MAVGLETRRHSARAAGIAFVCLTLLVFASGLDARPARGQTLTRPNIVLLYTDDQRAGTERYMTNVQSELVSRGRRYSNSFVVNPLCCPSRAAMLTSTYSHTNGIYFNTPRQLGLGGAVDFTNSGRDQSTIATWLHAAPYSYYTGMFGRYLNGYGDIAPYKAPGWDVWNPSWGIGGRGWGGYYDFGEVVNGSIRQVDCDQPYDERASCAYAADVVGANAVSFIESAPADRPIFAWASFYVPHPPTIPEPKFEHTFDWVGDSYRTSTFNEADVADKPKWVRRLPRFTADEKARIDDLVRRQLETLQSVDVQVGRIIAALAATGRLNNTLIAFTSDNGYLWGEHRLVGKNVAYNWATRVPLVVRWDAAGLTGVSNDPVYNIDLAPTFLGAADAQTDGSVTEGVDLLNASVPARRLIEHADGGASPAFCEGRTRRYAYVKLGTGEEEFYDYRRDPDEELNRATRESRHMRSLRRWTENACTPWPPGFTWRRLP